MNQENERHCGECKYAIRIDRGWSNWTVKGTEDHDIHGGEILWAEPTTLTKSFTGKEWIEMTKDDEVKQFTERVNAAAVAKDYWSTDFRRALYDAFVEESGKRLCEKYNNGESFSVTGSLE